MITTSRTISLFFLISILGLFSCVPVKRMAYVQSEHEKAPHEMVFTGIPSDDLIRPGDEIYVRISSADEQPTALTAEMQRGTYNAALQSYTVNEEGAIRLPYIGRITVHNLTLEQAAEKVEAALSQYLFLPNVYMRFINTRVTVLGEVNRPGVYMFDYKNINVLQALGYAGDIREYGNRKNILLIREDGTQLTKQYIDVTSDNLLESEFYTLQSGDIVYIEPLGRRVWGFTTIPYNLLLTVLSTSLVVYSFFNN